MVRPVLGGGEVCGGQGEGVPFAVDGLRAARSPGHSDPALKSAFIPFRRMPPQAQSPGPRMRRQNRAGRADAGSPGHRWGAGGKEGRIRSGRSVGSQDLTHARADARLDLRLFVTRQTQAPAFRLMQKYAQLLFEHPPLATASPTRTCPAVTGSLSPGRTGHSYSYRTPGTRGLQQPLGRLRGSYRSGPDFPRGPGPLPCHASVPG